MTYGAACWDIDLLCERLGIRVVSYEVGAEAIKAMHLGHLMDSDHSFSVACGNEPIIFFDNNQPLWAIHFSIAKCIGFFALGILTRECTGHLTRKEMFHADLFALKLLFLLAKANPQLLRKIVRWDADRWKARRKADVARWKARCKRKPPEPAAAGR